MKAITGRELVEQVSRMLKPKDENWQKENRRKNRKAKAIEIVASMAPKRKANAKERSEFKKSCLCPADHQMWDGRVPDLDAPLDARLVAMAICNVALKIN